MEIINLLFSKYNKMRVRLFIIFLFSLFICFTINAVSIPQNNEVNYDIIRKNKVIGSHEIKFINNRNFWVSIIHFYQIPNILFVPAKGTLAIADASIDKATRSSGSKL